MLYEGAIRFLQQAREAGEMDELQQRYDKLHRAGEIIIALQSALDMEGGGVQARDLYEFYAGIDTRIRDLHRHNDTAACDQLIGELRAMRDVWDAIERKNQTS